MEYLLLLEKDKLKIEAKIDSLKAEKESFSKKLGEAAAHGGSAMNGIPEYVYLENKIHRLDDEIIYFSKIIHDYKIIIPEEFISSFVTTYSKITADKDGQKYYFQILEPFLANNSLGRFQIISPKSPAGKAFLGKKIGEIATIDLPNQNQNYKILEININ